MRLGQYLLTAFMLSSTSGNNLMPSDMPSLVPSDSPSILPSLSPTRPFPIKTLLSCPELEWSNMKCQNGGATAAPSSTNTSVLSTSSASDLLSQVTTIEHGFSLSIWFESTHQGNFLSIQGPDCDLEITESRKTITVIYPSMDGSCMSATVDTEAAAGELLHLLLSVQDKQIRIYLNGILGNTPQHSPTIDATPIITSNAPIRIFDSWNGTIYLMEVMAGIESEEGAYDILARGLLPNMPVTSSNTTVVIYEDAEPVAGNSTLDWYRTMPQVEDAVTIELPWYSMQQQAEAVIHQAGIPSKQNMINLYFFVVELPHRGHMFARDGTELLTVGAWVPTKDQVVYIPPWNEHSIDDETPFTSFTYCFSNISIYHPNSCTNGTVAIIVQSVNDPPVAHGANGVKVWEGAEDLHTPSIHLRGIDIDQNDSVISVRISSQPSYGNLILSVGSFRADGIRHGTPVRELQEISTDDPVYVKYLWDPSTYGGSLTTDTAVEDAFYFQVSDSHGLWSSPERVSVHVYAAVNALLSSTTVLENEPFGGELMLPVVDNSGWNRTTGVFVDVLPAHGSVWNARTGKKVQEGDFITSDASLGAVSLTFTPKASYCTDDTVPSQMEYRAFTSVDSAIQSISSHTTHNISISCQVDPWNVSMPSSLFVKTSLLGTKTLSKCNDTWRLSDECGTVGYLGPVTVTHNEQHEYDVLVNVSSSRGFLSLEADSNAKWHRGRHSLQAGYIVLIVPLKTLSDTLSSLRYSTLSNEQDTIAVYLEYGDCQEAVPSNCLGWRQEIHVLVEPSAVPVVETSEIISGFPLHLLTIFLGYPAIYFLWALLEEECRTDDDDETVGDEEAGREGFSWVQKKNDLGEIYYIHLYTGECTYNGEQALREGFVPWRDPDEEEDLASPV